MDLGIKGKTALVTGSTKGIGFAIARALLKEGVIVTINGRKQDVVDAAVQALSKDGDVKGIASDLSTSQGATATTDKLPNVDILINNVGAYQPKAFSEISDEEWETTFQTNVMSGVRLSRFYLPKMLKQNWGRVIFISSESAVQIPVEMIHYGFSKTAQLAIARGMAETTKGTRVTVNSVLPGPTLSEGVSDFVAEMGKQKKMTNEQIEKEFFEHIRPSSLIQRFATSEEVASMVCYVSSELASATNGAALRVDGGVVRSIL
jgi:NAD(P)-dependent dehydrogenase (short-subunit alcohol dehydrogenase family)